MAFLPMILGGGTGEICTAKNLTNIYATTVHYLEHDCKKIWLIAGVNTCGYLKVNGTSQTATETGGTSLGYSGYGVFYSVYEGDFKTTDEIQFCAYDPSNMQNNGGTMIFY